MTNRFDSSVCVTNKFVCSVSGTMYLNVFYCVGMSVSSSHSIGNPSLGLDDRLGFVPEY